MDSAKLEAAREFIEQRAAATTAWFDAYIAERGLDYDESTWSEDDHAAYAAGAEALIAEWKAKAAARSE